jgi:hypothetical protein
MITVPSFPDPRFIRVSSVAPSLSSRLTSGFTRHSLTPILDIGRIHPLLPNTPKTLKTEN